MPVQLFPMPCVICINLIEHAHTECNCFDIQIISVLLIGSKNSFLNSRTAKKKWLLKQNICSLYSDLGKFSKCPATALLRMWVDFISMWGSRKNICLSQCQLLSSPMTHSISLRLFTKPVEHPQWLLADYCLASWVLLCFPFYSGTCLHSEPNHWHWAPSLTNLPYPVLSGT